MPLLREKLTFQTEKCSAYNVCDKAGEIPVISNVLALGGNEMKYLVPGSIA